MKSLALVAIVIILVVEVSFAKATFEPDRVLVGYYGESLCPDCIHFVDVSLSEAFEKIPELFTLHYVPSGNARLAPGGIKCQHGAMECVMNTYDACVLYFYPTNTKFWPFMKCTNSYGEDQTPAEGDLCATKSGFDVRAITNCRTGSLGRSLEMYYFNETDALQPPHQYTPWVTINGEHSTKAEGGMLISVICKAYRGQNKPKSCDGY